MGTTEGVISSAKFTMGSCIWRHGIHILIRVLSSWQFGWYHVTRSDSPFPLPNRGIKSSDTNPGNDQDSAKAQRMWSKGLDTQAR